MNAHDSLDRLMVPRIWAILIAAVVSGLVFTACGGSGPAETPAAARVVIEALPEHIDLREPPGEPDALVGTIHAGGTRSLFYLFVHGDEPFRHRKMVEALGGPGEIEDAELTDDYEFFVPPAPNDEVLKVQFKVEDALCEQATGKTCAVAYS